MNKVVLITGCSSGIGLSTAVLLAKNNYKVYTTMRDLSRKEKLVEAAKQANTELEILQLDVTDESSIKKTIDEVIAKEGRIDILVNNAAYGLRGTVENVTIDEIKQQFDTNVFGVVRVCQETLPHMRKQNSGHIINISSVAAARSLPYSGIYSATKCALEAISESMASELSLFGIKVTVIEPGPVSTDFAQRSLKYGTRLDDNNPYKEVLEYAKKTQDERLKTAQKPEEIAALIKEIIEAEKPHFRYQTREDGKKIADSKFKDITGDSVIETTKQQLMEWLGK